MVEIWKDIPGYEKLYQASNWGRIRSLDHWRNSGFSGYIQKGKILKTQPHRRGYLNVMLQKNKNKKLFYVHRLVYEAFNGPIPDGMQVNHINEDKTDNRLENLNLMTPKENIHWGSGIKRHIENRQISVLQLTLDGQLVREWVSMREAGRNGFCEESISDCCNGKLKSHKGFKWVKNINAYGNGRWKRTSKLQQSFWNMQVIVIKNFPIISMRNMVGTKVC